MTVGDDILEGLREIATSTLANALDDLGIEGVIQGLPAVGPGLRCVGRAVTAREITGPKASFPAEDFKVGHIIDAAGAGDVVVIDNAGHPVSTWGGMASYAARAKGVAGLLVDGGVRDREEILEFGFPVFARHMVPTPGRGRIRVESIGETVCVGGIRVRPGDVIVADGTGAVCLPQEHAGAAAALAARFAADDARAMEEMDKGLSFREALAKFKRI